MPTYNRAHLLAESIDSILVQEYQNWELIIVDDGSTDTTKVLLDYFTRLDPRIKYYKKKHSGISDTRNYAVEKATGDILVCTDSDDWNHPKRLKMISDYFKKKPSVDIFYSGWDISDENLNLIQRRLPPAFEPLKLLEAQAIAQPTLAFRKNVAKVVKYNDKLKAGEDWEWLIKCTLAGFKFGCLAQPLVKYRMHKGAVSVEKKAEVDAYDKKMIEAYKPLMYKKYGQPKKS